MNMKPILIHAHVFYPSVWPELRACLQNMAPHPMELWVTLVEPQAEIEADVGKTFPGSHVLRVENRGYDVAPFLQVLGMVNLDDYSYVVKLHTKRGDSTIWQDSLRGEEWRQALLGFLSSPAVFQTYLDAFARNARIGMQADYHLLERRDMYDPESKARLRQWLNGHNLPHRSFRFVAGTMFIARAALMKKVASYPWTLQDFEPAHGHTSSMAHVYERLFGYFISYQGYVLEDGPRHWQDMRHRINERVSPCLKQICRFFYQRKVTSRGRLIIKVCKVPVYISREGKVGS